MEPVSLFVLWSTNVSEHTFVRHFFHLPYYWVTLHKRYTNFSRNLNKTSKKTFQPLLKMTTFCLHTALQLCGPVINQFMNHGQRNFSHCLPNRSLQWVEILVSVGAGTSFQHGPQFTVEWIEVWAGGGPIICFDEIWDVLLQPFLVFHFVSGSLIFIHEYSFFQRW